MVVCAVQLSVSTRRAHNRCVYGKAATFFSSIGGRNPVTQKTSLVLHEDAGSADRGGQAAGDLQPTFEGI